MKKHLFFLILFIGLIAPISNNTAQSLIILHPNETYKAPPNSDMVLMDTYTFGNYHYTASQYDTLKKEVKRLDSTVAISDCNQTQLTKSYENLLVLKNSELATYQESYQRLETNTNTCIKEQQQLQIDYRKIEQKNRRIKTWRNWFMGTTAFLGAIIVMSVVK